MGHVENPDWVKVYDLKRRFGDVEECPQMGAGTKIDTKLGDMFVTKKIFDAPYFIHTHVIAMREGYLHRILDGLMKPFEKMLCADINFMDLDNLSLLAANLHEAADPGLTMGKNRRSRGSSSTTRRITTLSRPSLRTTQKAMGGT
ncbi:hypothetical protein LTR94_033314, partial [Friedmanniomyces endolithicus]